MAEAAKSMPATFVGSTLGGKYRIERVIGEGGMGVVYEATHTRIGQRVAVKILHPHMLARHDLVVRFEREARAAGKLTNANAVRIIDVDVTAQGLPYIVMEFLEGHDLEAELQARGTVPIGEAVSCVLQVAAAMEEAHAKGIVHRDLKPSNLFLTRDAGTGATIVKVLDFGISKMPRAEGEPNVTTTLTAMGTPLYMSPEQVRSAKNVDGRSDVWSLGVILFELVTGTPPFTGTAMAISAAIVADPPPRMRDVRPDVPEVLDSVILKALSKRPEDRWPDMRSFAEALAPFAPGDRRITITLDSGNVSRTASADSLVSGPTLHAERTSSVAETVLTSPRRRARARLIAALLALPLAGVAVLFVALHRPAAPAASTLPLAADPAAAPTAAAASAAASASSAPAATAIASSDPTAAESAPAVSVATTPSAGARGQATRPPASPRATAASPPVQVAPKATTNPVHL